MSFNKTIAVALAALLVQAALWSGPVRAAGNVEVEADQMEIIDAEHKTIFSGNVVSTRPSETIRSDEMIVTTSEVKQTDGTTKTITENVDAKGHVVITTKTQKITGDWAKFKIQTNELEVGGNVLVVQGESKLKGDRLVVDLNTNHLQMSGGRVKGSFVPK